MQFQPPLHELNLESLQRYSQDEVSLLNSRHRMNCEPSQSSTQREELNQQEMQIFKKQIEEKFKMSIANKIYTFPKRITNISDIISSSESDHQPEESSRRDRMVICNFKKRQEKHKSANKKKLNQSSQGCLENKGVNISNFKQVRQKSKGKETILKKKDSPQKKKGKEQVKLDQMLKTTKPKKRYQTFKTEHQTSGSFIESIKHKIKKN